MISALKDKSEFPLMYIVTNKKWKKTKDEKG